MNWETRAVRGAPTVEEAGPKQDGLPKQFWARILNYGVVDDYKTKFEAGAFTESLEKRLPRLMFGHAGWENPLALLGRGIDYRDSKDGLDVLFEFDDFEYVPMARQVAYQLTSGTLDEFSIGFIRQGERRDNMDSTTWITKGRLGEGSIVVQGSVPGTKVLQFRSANQHPDEGQWIAADDAARLLTRLSLGDIDLSDALGEVKTLVEASLDPQNPPDQEDDEQDPPPAAAEDDEDPPPADEEDPPADEPDPAELDLEEELIGELNEVLEAVGVRQRLFEYRGDKSGHPFRGNQHTKKSGGGGGAPKLSGQGQVGKARGVADDYAERGKTDHASGAREVANAKTRTEAQQIVATHRVDARTLSSARAADQAKGRHEGARKAYQARFGVAPP
jgi:HK97 family phage prohead protease